MRSFLVSLRDTVLVARFELLRSIRDWLAVTLFALYTLIMAGVAYGFTRLLLATENAAAEAMGVPKVKRPGAMISSLQGDTSKLVDSLTELFEDRSLVRAWLDLDLPILVMVHLPVGLFIIPFLAAFTSADCIAADVKTRALRYECLRVGRVEFVYGRFFGQLLLMAVAVLLAGIGTWTIGMFFMNGVTGPELAWRLIWVSPRLLLAAIPFVAIGTICSQLTESPNVARLLGLGATLGTVILYGIAEARLSRKDASMGWDLINQVLPWTWLDGMLRFGPELLTSGAVLAGMGMAYAAIGLLRFQWRDL